MSGKVQSLNSIAPMIQSETTSSSGPEQSEYEEGKKCFEDGNYGQAALSLHNALVGFEEKSDENGIANASNQLGHVCLAKKDYDKALVHYQRAFEICDKINDRMSMLAVLHKVVKVYRYQGLLDKAVDSCLDILDHYHDNRDPRGSVAILEEMAEIYIEAGDTAKAADSYRTISSVHKNFNHEKIAADYLQKANKLEG